MKHTLQIIIVSILSGILLSSCGSQTSIMKRKYNKGYYVSHSHKQNNSKVETLPKEETPLVMVKKENSLKELALVETAEPELKIEKNEAPVLLATATKASDSKVATSKKTTNTFAKYTFKKIEQIAPAQLRDKLEKKGRDGGLIAATLSLFWIVLLCILILYVFGLAFDGFGLGWAIHLLALIFVILLILWLLGAV